VVVILALEHAHESLSHFVSSRRRRAPGPESFTAIAVAVEARFSELPKRRPRPRPARLGLTYFASARKPAYI
jgi:hypothetical protein